VNVDPERTSIVRQDDIPTSVMQVVTSPPPPARKRGTAAIVGTWAGFAVVAVAVVWATTAWAASLRGPGDGSQDGVPILANLPTLSATTSPPPVSEEPAPETGRTEERQPEATRAPRPERTAPVAPVQPSAVQPPPPPATSATSEAPVVPPPTTAPPTTTRRGSFLNPDNDPPPTTAPRPTTAQATPTANVP
jgi:hypothetical protein